MVHSDCRGQLCGCARHSAKDHCIHCTPGFVRELGQLSIKPQQTISRKGQGLAQRSLSPVLRKQLSTQSPESPFIHSLVLKKKKSDSWRGENRVGPGRTVVGELSGKRSAGYRDEVGVGGKSRGCPCLGCRGSVS